MPESSVVVLRPALPPSKLRVHIVDKKATVTAPARRTLDAFVVLGIPRVILLPPPNIQVLPAIRAVRTVSHNRPSCTRPTPLSWNVRSTHRSYLDMHNFEPQWTLSQTHSHFF